MKKKSVIVLLVCMALALVLALAFTACRYIFLSPMLFQNSSVLNSEGNNQVKNLILDTIKDEHSALAQNKTSDSDDSMDNDNSIRSLFVVVNGDFMKSLEKTEDGNFTVEVKMSQPDDWKYYFTVCESDGEYSILYYEIDP